MKDLLAPPSADPRAWLLHHPEALEPGLRLADAGPQLDLPLAPAAIGPDPLGRPCFLFLRETPAEAELAERLLETAARLRDAQPALEAWFARPAAPRLLLVAPAYPLAQRGRLGLIATGLDLLAWTVVPGGEEDPRPRFRLEIPGAPRPPLAAAAAFPAPLLPRLRRLLFHAERIRPEIVVRGASAPLHFTAGAETIAVLHRDGEEALFVSRLPSGRPEVLRLDDEESVDRALDALLRAQYARALGA